MKLNRESKLEILNKVTGGYSDKMLELIKIWGGKEIEDDVVKNINKEIFSNDDSYKVYSGGSYRFMDCTYLELSFNNNFECDWIGYTDKIQSYDIIDQWYAVYMDRLTDIGIKLCNTFGGKFELTDKDIIWKLEKDYNDCNLEYIYNAIEITKENGYRNKHLEFDIFVKIYAE